MMPILVVAGALAVLTTPQPVIRHARLLPAIPKVETITCSAPRPQWIVNASEHFGLIVMATIINPEFTKNNILATVRVDRFLKGRFQPSTIKLSFATDCGWGGARPAKGDELTLYMQVAKTHHLGKMGIVVFWRPASRWPE
jgi:hypothetical protein